VPAAGFDPVSLHGTKMQSFFIFKHQPEETAARGGRIACHTL
jgi:hypothetical protein